jgi:hypothetical protein
MIDGKLSLSVFHDSSGAARVPGVVTSTTAEAAFHLKRHEIILTCVHKKK